APVGRDEVDAGRLLARGLVELLRVGHPDLRRLRPGVAERLLQRLGHGDSRQLVVQPQREAVAPDRADADEHRDRRGAAELLEEAVEVLEVENRSEEHTSELQSLAYLVCRL